MFYKELSKIAHSCQNRKDSLHSIGVRRPKEFVVIIFSKNEASSNAYSISVECTSTVIIVLIIINRIQASKLRLELKNGFSKIFSVFIQFAWESLSFNVYNRASENESGDQYIRVHHEKWFRKNATSISIRALLYICQHISNDSLLSMDHQKLSSSQILFVRKSSSYCRKTIYYIVEKCVCQMWTRVGH